MFLNSEYSRRRIDSNIKKSSLKRALLTFMCAFALVLCALPAQAWAEGYYAYWVKDADGNPISGSVDINQLKRGFSIGRANLSWGQPYPASAIVAFDSNPHHGDITLPQKIYSMYDRASGLYVPKNIHSGDTISFWVHFDLETPTGFRGTDASGNPLGQYICTFTLNATGQENATQESTGKDAGGEASEGTIGNNNPNSISSGTENPNSQASSTTGQPAQNSSQVAQGAVSLKTALEKKSSYENITNESTASDATVQQGEQNTGNAESERTFLALSGTNGVGKDNLKGLQELQSVGQMFGIAGKIGLQNDNKGEAASLPSIEIELFGIPIAWLFVWGLVLGALPFGLARRGARFTYKAIRPSRIVV